MVELAYTPDLESGPDRVGGSSPLKGITKENDDEYIFGMQQT